MTDSKQRRMTMTERRGFGSADDLGSGLRVDSVGHLLEIGDELTCMCCGSIAIVTKWPTDRDHGFAFDGSQWVLTPEWVKRLRKTAAGVEMTRTIENAHAMQEKP